MFLEATSDLCILALTSTQALNVLPAAPVLLAFQSVHVLIFVRCSKLQGQGWPAGWQIQTVRLRASKVRCLQSPHVQQTAGARKLAGWQIRQTLQEPGK